MPDLGTMYVPIVPTTRGIAGAVYKELGPQVAKAAERAGADAGRSITREISGAMGGLGRAGRTLGADLSSAMAPAVSAVQRFTSGFNNADAAASSFTGRMGALGGEARRVADRAALVGNNFRAGFNDADAAASSFTGRMGTLGGVVRKVADTALAPGRNLRAGFDDAQAAASSFTGRMGTVGGAVRKVADAALAPGRNFRAGFNDAGAAASSFTGRMGTVGGAVARVASTATSHLTAVGSTTLATAKRVAGGVSSTVSTMGTVVGGVRGAFVTFGQSASQAIAPLRSRVESVTTGLTNLAGGAVTAGAAVVGAVGSIAAVGGFSRAVQIEQAQAKLKGLGNSTQDIQKIMENANNAVKGTSAALNEAASVAAASVASGVKPGKDLEQVLRTINDTAGIAGITMGESGAIFNSVLARGKLQGDDMLQLTSRGVPVLQFLADKLGTTSDAVSDMVSKGKIDFKTFEEAMREGVGGSAEAMGHTTAGALANLRTAISRLGANAITPFMPLIQGLALGLANVADAVGKGIAPALSAAGKIIQSFMGSFGDVEGRMNLVKTLASVGVDQFGLFGRAVLGARDSIRAFVSGVQAGGDDITSSGIPGFFEGMGLQIRNAVDRLAEFKAALPGPALAGIAAVLGTVGAAFGSMISGSVVEAFAAFASKIPIVGESLANLVGRAGLLSRVLGVLGGPLGLVIQLVIAAVASSSELRGMLGDLAGTVLGLVGTVAAQLVPVFAQLASSVLPAIATVLHVVVSAVASLLIAILPLVSTLLTSLVPVIVQLVSTILPPVVAVISAVVQVLAVLLGALMPVITTILSVLVPVLQFVVTVIAGLVSAILTGLGAAFTWLATVAGPMVGVALQAIGGFFSWLWTGVIQPAWNGIIPLIGGVVTWIASVAGPMLQAALQVLGAVFSWLYVNVVQPVWNGIKVVIVGVLAVLMTVIDGFVAFYRAVLAPVFTWLRDAVVIPAWNGIRNAIAAAWTWIRDVVLTPLINFVRGPLTAAWRWISAVVGQVWAAIKSAVSSAWSWVRDVVLVPLINFVRGALTAAWRWIAAVVSQVWSGIRNTIANVWNWIRDVVLTPLINFVRGALTAAWRWIGSIVSQVWSGIRTTVANTWNTVRNNILQPMIGFLRGAVVNAWNAAKNGIAKAWGAVKAVVDTPVDFVINTVLNGGFIKNFNKLAGKFGIKPLDEIHYKGLARGGRVPGYTAAKRDDHLYPVAGGGVQPLRGGEGITVPEGMRALDSTLGAGFHSGLNAAANAGGVSGAKRWIANTMPGIDQAKPSIETFPHDRDKRFAVGPPGGPSGGLWSSNQARASQLGYFMVPRGSLAGVSFESAARAWMGRSALDIRMGSGGPGVQSISGGGGGPWGFATSDGRITITPGGPARVGKAAVRGTLAHEIGHVLSLNHPPGGYGATGSIMSAGMNGGYWPSSLDYAKLAEIYGRPGEGVKTYDDPGGGGGLIAGLLDAIGFDKLIGKVPGGGFAKDLIIGGAKNLWEGFKTWAAKMLNPFDGGDSEVAGEQSAEKWRDTVIAALKRAGVPSTKPYQDAWVKQIATESGGDPNAIQGNIGDVNNATGDLAKGLVQVIGSTFAAHRDPSLPNNQLDPLANLTAGIRYAKGRYGVEGMLQAIGKGHGYALGGVLPENLGKHSFQFSTPGAQVFDGGGWLRRTSDPMLVHHRESKPDAVLTNGQFADFHAIAESVRSEGGGDRPTMEPHFHIEGTPEDPDRMGRRAMEAFAFEAMKVGIV